MKKGEYEPALKELEKILHDKVQEKFKLYSLIENKISEQEE